MINRLLFRVALFVSRWPKWTIVGLLAAIVVLPFIGIRTGPSPPTALSPTAPSPNSTSTTSRQSAISSLRGGEEPQADSGRQQEGDGDVRAARGI